MMIGLIGLAQAIIAPAPGIPQIPATAWSCELRNAAGEILKVAGIAPEFHAGFDPNGVKFIDITGTPPFNGKAGISPGDASDYFREYQVGLSTRAGETFRLNLKLRRGGTSIAYTTRFVHTGKPIPYDYHAAGLCTAQFGSSLPQR